MNEKNKNKEHLYFIILYTLCPIYYVIYNKYTHACLCIFFLGEPVKLLPVCQYPNN